ncbi:hypothetical protein EJ06DRAFT_41752 [Trichodelitschia bisporula]|uniref:Uncharacterized protein n=1 Tax=Trichodelitschia bisporula TaxID=703511 RepID=A0A6G1HVY5_9PEZI|nr:hypothetical protein EJ06DRAFT_41752 [Trichodelitschia bisporula]
MGLHQRHGGIETFSEEFCPSQPYDPPTTLQSASLSLIWMHKFNTQSQVDRFPQKMEVDMQPEPQPNSALPAYNEHDHRTPPSTVANANGKTRASGSQLKTRSKTPDGRVPQPLHPAREQHTWHDPRSHEYLLVQSSPAPLAHNGTCIRPPPQHMHLRILPLSKPHRHSRPCHRHRQSRHVFE